MGDSPELAMMGNTSLDFYFKDQHQRMDMKMMNGMMRVQTFVQLNQLTSSAILMDMMGQKYHITELEEKDLDENNNFMNMNNVKTISYNKKDKKVIANYPCYLAVITTKDDQTHKYYITERIKPPTGLKQKTDIMLKGYPLEMIIPNDQFGNMIFTATSVSAEVTGNDFKIPEGYKQITMAEFEKEMNPSGK